MTAEVTYPAAATLLEYTPSIFLVLGATRCHVLDLRAHVTNSVGDRDGEITVPEVATGEVLYQSILQ